MCVLVFFCGRVAARKKQAGTAKRARRLEPRTRGMCTRASCDFFGVFSPQFGFRGVSPSAADIGRRCPCRRAGQPGERKSFVLHTHTHTHTCGGERRCVNSLVHIPCSYTAHTVTCALLSACSCQVTAYVFIAESMSIHSWGRPMFVRPSVHTLVHMDVCMYVCLYACMYVDVYFASMRE